MEHFLDLKRRRENIPDAVFCAVAAILLKIKAPLPVWKWGFASSQSSEN